MIPKYLIDSLPFSIENLKGVHFDYHDWHVTCTPEMGDLLPEFTVASQVSVIYNGYGDDAVKLIVKACEGTRWQFYFENNMIQHETLREEDKRSMTDEEISHFYKEQEHGRIRLTYTERTNRRPQIPQQVDEHIYVPNFGHHHH